MKERIRQMLVKEFIQLFRDPRMRAILIGPPLIQLIVFGYAVNTDVRHVATVIHDLDRSVQSRELVSRFVASGYFDVVEYAAGNERIGDLLDHGKAQAAIQINPGFGADVLAGRTAPMQVIVDGTDSITAGIVLNYSRAITERYSQEHLRDRLDRRQGRAPRPGGVELASRAWFNENLESRYFYVPGVIAILVMLITLLLTSMAVVREKEIGTMEQIMVTPITPVEFILGKTVPFALVAFVQVIVVTVIGVNWFGVPIRGYPPLLLAGAALYLLCGLGVGLFISSVCQTQQQAMMSTFFFFFPAMLLSGFAFPIANMPEPVQWLTYINPLRYFLVILRGIFLKGVGWNILWPQYVGLAVLGPTMLLLASLRLRKKLA